MQQFTVLGRRIPSETCKEPEVYKMTIFAPNEVVAESRFWYHMNQLNAIKKSAGQLVSMQKVEEDAAEVKSYGVHLRYRDAIGHHNMYREARETTAARAMAKIFNEMAGQYHIRYQDIQIIRFDILTAVYDKNMKPEELAHAMKRTKTIMMVPHEGHELKFPHPFANSSVKRNARVYRFAKKVPSIDM